MPLYEYQCEECGARSEHLQRIDDPAPGSCDACGAKGSLRRLLSSPAFQFKGSGWYVTDYARSGGGKAGKAESGGAEVKAGGESKGGGEAKAGAEAKAESAPASSGPAAPSSATDG